MNIVRISLELGCLLQLPTDIEVQTLADDGSKVRVTFGDIIKGKKASAAAPVDLFTFCSEQRLYGQ